MSYVRSFEDFYPPKRFDDLPFTKAVIEESTEEAAGYVEIETITLDPVDTDPSDPQGRDFTTASAEHDPAYYRIVWTDASGSTFHSDPVYFTSPAATYATAAQLRTKLGVNAEQLTDTEATALIREAEDLIDERLGNRPIDESTGRRVEMDDDDIKAWQYTKLAEATVEIAAVIFSDPGVASRQRARFSSGDITINGFYGPAFGERAAALLSQSGLIRNTARMSGNRRRCYQRSWEPTQ